MDSASMKKEWDKDLIQTCTKGTGNEEGCHSTEELRCKVTKDKWYLKVALESEDSVETAFFTVGCPGGMDTTITRSI